MKSLTIFNAISPENELIHNAPGLATIFKFNRIALYNIFFVVKLSFAYHIVSLWQIIYSINWYEYPVENFVPV